MKTLLLAILTAFVVTACGSALSYQLKGSELSPGADATLKADVQQAQHLTRFDLQASNLAPAGRVGEGATTYVVWARPNFRTPWTRLGALDLGDDGRTGNATLTYAEVDFDVLVTAEPDAEVDSPSQMHLFKQHVGGEKDQS